MRERPSCEGSRPCASRYPGEDRAMQTTIEIGRKRRVGPGQPVYVVAEVSANHNRDFDCAAELLREIEAAGADAVQLQTYTPDTLTLRADSAPFRIGGDTLWDGR